MFGVGYFRGQPTEYVLKYTSGRLTKQGMGLSFPYLQHNTQIVAVPTSSADANFVFNETTTNFQSVTIQGQCTYRVRDALQAAGILNFAIDPKRRTYLSNDPDRLAQRITNVIHMVTRSEIQRRTLEETIRETQEIAARVLASIREGDSLQTLDVELLSVYILAAKPTPEVAKALEAEYRETLLRKADEAIYARRAAAVAEERKIKENELASQVALEQQRQQLIEREGQNAQQVAEYHGRALEMEADYRARALEKELAVYRAMEPRMVVAAALKDLGLNAAKIGTLTITPELLAAILGAQTADGRGE